MLSAFDSFLLIPGKKSVPIAVTMDHISHGQREACTDLGSESRKSCLSAWKLTMRQGRARTDSTALAKPCWPARELQHRPRIFQDLCSSACL